MWERAYPRMQWISQHIRDGHTAFASKPAPALVLRKV